MICAAFLLLFGHQGHIQCRREAGNAHSGTTALCTTDHGVGRRMRYSIIHFIIIVLLLLLFLDRVALLLLHVSAETKRPYTALLL
jgi:hypothetical protein